MPRERRLFVGPTLKRLRRDLGLTQEAMAADLNVSSSYIALLEGNHRPLSAELLVRLASTYKLDVSVLSGRGVAENEARIRAVLADPLLADIELPSLEAADLATNFPGVMEALLRLHTAYREEQLALADRGRDGAAEEHDAVAEARRFLATRRNCFPGLDSAAERIGEASASVESLSLHLERRHGLRVRRLPAAVMVGSVRRLDHHRREVLLDDGLDTASQRFQLALQIVYLEMSETIDAGLAGGDFETESGARLARRALASYAAAAVLMPYAQFLKAAEARHYDVEALGRQFAASFEQIAHRLTTLQAPGREGVPFFFVRVDEAGNVSKRLDGAGFPFARHGGGCPLWSVHQVFRTPRRVVTQWLELPDGQRFFSIARTVTSGGGAFGAQRVERAIALGCAAEHAHRLVYAEQPAASSAPAAMPIGITCKLCQRAECAARSAPPIGRQILPDDLRRTHAPFGFSGA